MTNDGPKEIPISPECSEAMLRALRQNSELDRLRDGAAKHPDMPIFAITDYAMRNALQEASATLRNRLDRANGDLAEKRA